MFSGYLNRAIWSLLLPKLWSEELCNHHQQPWLAMISIRCLTLERNMVSQRRPHLCNQSWILLRSEGNTAHCFSVHFFSCIIFSCSCKWHSIYNNESTCRIVSPYDMFQSTWLCLNWLHRNWPFDSTITLHPPRRRPWHQCSIRTGHFLF